MKLGPLQNLNMELPNSQGGCYTESYENPSCETWDSGSGRFSGNLTPELRSGAMPIRPRTREDFHRRDAIVPIDQTRRHSLPSPLEPRNRISESDRALTEQLISALEQITVQTEISNALEAKLAKIITVSIILLLIVIYLAAILVISGQLWLRLVTKMTQLLHLLCPKTSCRPRVVMVYINNPSPPSNHPLMVPYLAYIFCIFCAAIFIMKKGEKKSRDIEMATTDYKTALDAYVRDLSKPRFLGKTYSFLQKPKYLWFLEPK